MVLIFIASHDFVLFKCNYTIQKNICVSYTYFVSNYSLFLNTHTACLVLSVFFPMGV